ncbi:sugar phosphate isomerase/epimerase [Marinomonas agarivorans]|nr:sugar phosphate isomerase/epimerase [Marinomonas agarivorans]
MNDWSFQLYSARHMTNLEEVLVILKQLGYTQVEGYGSLYQQYPQLADLLKQHHLTMPTGHIQFDWLINDMPQVIDIVTKLDMKIAICPFLAPEMRPTDAAGWREIGAKMEQACQQLQIHQVQVAWHNHEFEFMPLEDGSYPMALLLDSAPSLQWEADVAWAYRAGVDPVTWLTKYQDRLCGIHLKDQAPTGECVDEDGWADFGHGILPWQEWWQIIKASSARFFVAEHDNPNDVNRFASRAIAAANRL